MTGSRPADSGLRRRGWIVALGAMTVDIATIGIVIPAVPDLIRTVTGESLPVAAWYGGLLLTLSATLRLVFGPLVGAMSDAWGRRPMLLMSIAGLGVDHLLAAASRSLLWMLAGRIVSGMFGLSAVTVGAYVADVFPPNQRGRAFGLIGAGFGVGLVVGPALGAVFGPFGPRAAFSLAATLSAANLIVCFLFFPETLPRRARRPLRLTRAHLPGAFVVWRSAAKLGKIGVASLLMNIALSVYFAVWSFWLETRFHWGAREVGLTLAGYGMAGFVAQAFLVGPMVARLGERRTALVGLGAGLVCALGFAMVTQEWVVPPLVALSGLQSVALPVLMAMASGGVEAEHQGEVQGIFSGLHGLANIIGPPAMAGIFRLATQAGSRLLWPGAPFAVAALFLISAMVVIGWCRKPQHGPPRHRGCEKGAAL